MKKIILSVVCTCYFSIAWSQFYKSFLPSEAFSDSLTKIVKDYQKNFYAIQGKQLSSDGLVDIYNSNVSIPGAVHCVVQRYHSAEDTSASWQAIMYTGENYEEAVKIYKKTFHLLKKTKLKWADKVSVSFKGNLEIPEETLRFTSTPLTLNVNDSQYTNFFAEVELINLYEEWEVHINLHKKKTDEERY